MGERPEAHRQALLEGLLQGAETGGGWQEGGETGFLKAEIGTACYIKMG